MSLKDILTAPGRYADKLNLETAKKYFPNSDPNKINADVNLALQGAMMGGSIANVGEGTVMAPPTWENGPAVAEEAAAPLASEAPTVTETVPRESLADDYTQQVDSLYPEAAPETKAGIAQFLKNHAGKVAAASVGVPLIGETMSLSAPQMLPGGRGRLFTDRPELGEQLPGGRGRASVVPNDPTVFQNRSGIGTPEHPDVTKFVDQEAPIEAKHVTSGVKPIAPEVKGSVHDSATSSLEERPSINTVENLMSAQKAAGDAEFANRLGRAGELVGTAFSHTKPVAQEAFNEQIKAAGEIPKNFEELAEKEKEDAGSGLSQGFRDFIKSTTGTAIPSNMSATQAAKIMPYAFQKYEKTEAAKQHHEDLAYKYNELKALQKMKGDEKSGSDQDKSIVNAQKMLDSQTKKVTDTSSAVNAAKDVLAEATTNPTAANALSTHMARIASGGQRINTVEMAAFGGSKALSDKVQQIIKTGASGTITSENAKFAQQYLDAIDRANQESYRQISEPIIQRTIKNSKKPLEYKDAYERITGKFLPETTGPQATSLQTDTVSVISPTGQKGTIPKANLEKALAKGYKAVE